VCVGVCVCVCVCVGTYLVETMSRNPFQRRPKHVEANFKCFNPYPANVENMVSS